MSPDTAEGTDHREAMVLAATENDRFVALAAQLTADDWSQPTDCDKWTVKDIVAHVVGTFEANASMRENVHQMRAARKADGPFVDALSDVQVRERSPLSPTELVARLRRTAPKAAAGRKRVPAPVRNLVKIHVQLGSIDERWPLGFLIDTIYTRDTWMHRVDVSRATGRDLVLTPEHDGRIVAGVVAEWARRHGRPYALHLDGPAGGTFVHGDGGEQHHLDAVEFCRITSGRATGDGLLTQEVAF